MRRAAFLFVLGLVLAWGIAATVLFGWPRESAPRQADAVVVLSGGKGPRLERALGLVRRGVADVLVVSDGWDPSWPEANRLCAGRSARFEVVCVQPSPYSTRGEARAVARLASARTWDSVVVVTSTYHVTRARMLFERCLDADVQAVGARYAAGQIPDALASETVKLVYALTLARGC